MAEEAKNKQAKDQPTEKAKGGILRKVLKVFAWIVGIVVALVVLVVVTTPLWLGPLAKNIANGAVPKLTGCEFKLEELSVNPFSGRVFLRECRLKNPEGYKKDEAFAVSTVVVDVAVCSLMTDEIHVETIEIHGLRASYLSDGKGVNNFERMLAHMDGKEPGAEPTEEELAAKKAADEAEAVKKAEAEKKAEESEDAGPKVVIDHFEMTDSKISYGIVRGTPPITLPLPRVTLDDIGKDKEGGTTFADALSAIWNACLKAAGSAGEQVKKLGSAVGEAAGVAVDAVGDAAGAAAGAVGNAAGVAAEAVGNAAGAAVDAVKSIGGLFKGDGKDDKEKKQ